MIEFQLDDKTFTLHETSAAAAEAAAQRAEAAAETVSGSVAQIATNTQDITALKEDFGDMSDLETEDKSSIVAAINEAMGSGGGLDLADLTMAAAVSQTAGYSTLTLSDDQGTSKSVEIPVNTLSNQDTEYIDNLVQEYLQTLVVDGDGGEY